MKTLVGTSGWIYKDWAKRFYPTTLKHEYKLTYFAHHFPTVEINSTFYRLPTDQAVANWYGSTPKDFIFTAKLSRYLTHLVQLKPGEKLETGIDNYFQRIKGLKEKLGCLLVQLPARFQAKPDRLENLVRLIKLMKSKYKLRFDVAIEFRHQTWFTSKILDMLSKEEIANVIGSGPGRWAESRAITAKFGFIRFHGSKWLYASSYTDAELDEWAKFIKLQKWQRCYCYFNNDKSAKAVDNAKYLMKALK